MNNLTARETEIIRESLLIVTKMQGIGLDQMKELITIIDKLKEPHANKVK